MHGDLIPIGSAPDPVRVVQRAVHLGHPKPEIGGHFCPFEQQIDCRLQVLRNPVEA